MPRLPESEEWLSVRASAELLGCHPDTIRRRIADGILPAQRFGPKLLRVRRRDLEKLSRPVTSFAQYREDRTAHVGGGSE